MGTFYRKLNHHLKCRGQRENFQTNLVKNVGTKVKVKQKSISSITNMVYQLPQELLNDLRLRIEILETFQFKVET